MSTYQMSATRFNCIEWNHSRENSLQVIAMWNIPLCIDQSSAPCDAWLDEDLERNWNNFYISLARNSALNCWHFVWNVLVKRFRHLNNAYSIRFQRCRVDPCAIQAIQLHSVGSSSVGEFLTSSHGTHAVLPIRSCYCIVRFKHLIHCNYHLANCIF